MDAGGHDSLSPTLQSHSLLYWYFSGYYNLSQPSGPVSAIRMSPEAGNSPSPLVPPPLNLGVQSSSLGSWNSLVFLFTKKPSPCPSFVWTTRFYLVRNFIAVGSVLQVTIQLTAIRNFCRITCHFLLWKEMFQDDKCLHWPVVRKAAPLRRYGEEAGTTQTATEAEWPGAEDSKEEESLNGLLTTWGTHSV